MTGHIVRNYAANSMLFIKKCVWYKTCFWIFSTTLSHSSSYVGTKWEEYCHKRT